MSFPDSAQSAIDWSQSAIFKPKKQKKSEKREKSELSIPDASMGLC